MFQNLATGDRNILFESGISCIETVKTCLVVGQYGTGKTATCCHCIENLGDGQLAMYLDYDNFKGNERQMSVEAVIGECMKDLQPDEISFALEWMKEKSQLVVFFVENLSFPAEYSSKIVQYGEVIGMEHIFYNLGSARREIFPDARIICTTRYKHLNILLHPTRALQVSGWHDVQMKNIIKEISGPDKERVVLNEALTYFCINPLYSDIILNLDKMGRGLDFKSISGMVITLIEDSMNRLLHDRKIVRLEEFVTAIHHSQSNFKIYGSASTRGNASTGQISGITEMSTQRRSCEKLHEDVMKALYFGYFCSSKEFDLVFAEKDGIVVLLASGMLEETRTRRLEELFRPTGKPSVKVQKKAGKLKEYLNKKMKQMHKHVSTNHKFALCLLQTSIELGCTKMADASIVLEIRNSSDPQKLNEVAMFLAEVQEDFCPRIKVKVEKNIPEKSAETINAGIKKNRFTIQVCILIRINQF